MLSYVNQLDNKVGSMATIQQKLLSAEGRLKSISGFSHYRLIPNVCVPDTCLLITFWQSRQQALFGEQELDAILGRCHVRGH